MITLKPKGRHVDNFLIIGCIQGCNSDDLRPVQPVARRSSVWIELLVPIHDVFQIPTKYSIVRAKMVDRNATFITIIQVLNLRYKYTIHFYIIVSLQVYKAVATETKMWYLISSPTTPTVCVEQISGNFQSRNVTSTWSSSQK